MMRLQRTSVISALSLPAGAATGSTSVPLRPLRGGCCRPPGLGDAIQPRALRLGTARTGAGRKTRGPAAGSGGITPCPRWVQLTAGQGSILTRPNSQHERAIERGAARCYPPAAATRASGLTQAGVVPLWSRRISPLHSVEGAPMTNSQTVTCLLALKTISPEDTLVFRLEILAISTGVGLVF